MDQPPEERFKVNVITLSQLIYNVVCDAANRGFNIVDSKLIVIASGILAGYNNRIIIDNFIKRSYLCWGQILTKHRQFFSEKSDDIFRDLPMGKVSAFKQLFESKDKNGNPVISPEIEEQIWNFFHTFVKISIKYIYKERMKDGKFMTEIEISDGKKKGVELLNGRREIELLSDNSRKEIEQPNGNKKKMDELIGDNFVKLINDWKIDLTKL